MDPRRLFYLLREIHLGHQSKATPEEIEYLWKKGLAKVKPPLTVQGQILRLFVKGLTSEGEKALLKLEKQFAVGVI